MKVFGSNELKRDVIDRGLCIGCGACIGICPYFETHKGKTAILFPCTLEQGRCFAYCPMVEVDLEALTQLWFGRSYDASPLGPILHDSHGEGRAEGERRRLPERRHGVGIDGFRLAAAGHDRRGNTHRQGRDPPGSPAGNRS